MIERELGGGFYLECDCCDETIGGFDTFEEAVAWKKENWVSKKDKQGHWQEFCKECAEVANEPDLAGF